MTPTSRNCGPLRHLQETYNTERELIAEPMEEPAQCIALVRNFDPFLTPPCQSKHNGVGIAEIIRVAQAQFEDRTRPRQAARTHWRCESQAWSLSICGLRRLRAGRRRVTIRSSTVLSARSWNAEYIAATGGRTEMSISNESWSP